ncbi:hypothetical protein FACS1894172_20880 [Spirochaetia bacterium]|nr:hypothetical protein FACS1894172_20880 [Spirochaetia bacterium]
MKTTRNGGSKMLFAGIISMILITVFVLTGCSPLLGAIFTPTTGSTTRTTGGSSPETGNTTPARPASTPTPSSVSRPVNIASGDSPETATTLIDVAWGSDGSDISGDGSGTPATGSYNVGGAGPAGGLVFYDKGDYRDGWRYLEVATEDAGQAVWGANGHKLGGTSATVGTGKRNTEVIMYYLRNAGETGAAQSAQLYTQGGYKDWFLPSKDELNLVYQNLRQKLLGNFSMGFYWSSSESSDYTAYSQRFSDGRQESSTNMFSSAGKSSNQSVRAIRQF